RSFPFRRLHWPQDVLFAATERIFGPPAEPQPCELLRADGADHRSRAIVTPRAAVRVNANRTQRQLHFIPHHQQRVLSQLVLREKLSYRDAAQIHVRLWLGEEHFFPGNLAPAYERFSFRPLDAHSATVPQLPPHHQSPVTPPPPGPPLA